MFREFLNEWFVGVYNKTILASKSWGRDYGHPYRSFFPIELMDKLEHIIQRDQRRGRPCFLSVNYYRGNTGRPGEPVALEKLFFDLDYPANIDRARADARRLVDLLSSYCKPLLVFSGGKGYHVYCYIETPIEGSKTFLKNVLDILVSELKVYDLGLVSLDERVVKDVSRLSRIPYTLHDKTRKQVTPLDYDFKPISMDSFDLKYYIGNPIRGKILNKSIDKALIMNRPLKDGSLSRKRSSKRLSWLKMFEDRKLLDSILSEGKTFGEDPLEIARQLALYFRNIEMKEFEECRRSLIEWCRRTKLLSVEKVDEIASKHCI